MTPVEAADYHRPQIRAFADAGADLRVTVADVAGGRRPRLDAFLAARLPDASRARLAAAVKAGGVSVNGAAAGRASAPL